MSWKFLLYCPRQKEMFMVAAASGSAPAPEYITRMSSLDPAASAGAFVVSEQFVAASSIVQVNVELAASSLSVMTHASFPTPGAALTSALKFLATIATGTMN